MLVQSLGTEWGLFRHYWIVVKLLITVLATILLLVHMQPTSRLAGAAAEGALSNADLGKERIQLVSDSGAAVLALLVATALSVYKPRGMTPFGLRQHEQDDTGMARIRRSTTNSLRWVKVLVIIVVVLVSLIVILHLTGRGLGEH